MRPLRLLQPAFALVVALALAYVALATPTAPRTPREATLRTAASGDLAVSQRANGDPVFTLTAAGPGSTGEGTMQATNPLDSATVLQLRGTGVSDTAGPFGGTLTEVLLLRVFEQASDGEVLRFAGKPRELQPIDLGSIGARATRSFRFAIEWVDGGEPAGPGLGDNALQGASTSMSWAFAVDVPEAGVAGTVQTPQVAGLPAACLSRRAFPIRVRAQRVRSARIWVAGTRVPVRIRRGRATATVDARGRTKGTLRVDIAVTLKSGRRLAGTRRYRLCAPPKARRSTPKL